MDGGERFTRPIPGINVPEHQPETANYYPEDMTQKEFLDWVATLPEPEQKKAKGYFWLVRRDANGKLKLVPYSQEYRVILELASRVGFVIIMIIKFRDWMLLLDILEIHH